MRRCLLLARVRVGPDVVGRSPAPRNCITSPHTSRPPATVVAGHICGWVVLQRRLAPAPASQAYWSRRPTDSRPGRPPDPQGVLARRHRSADLPARSAGRPLIGARRPRVRPAADRCLLAARPRPASRRCQHLTKAEGPVWSFGRGPVHRLFVDAAPVNRPDLGSAVSDQPDADRSTLTGRPEGPTGR